MDIKNYIMKKQNRFKKKYKIKNNKKIILLLHEF